MPADPYARADGEAKAPSRWFLAYEPRAERDIQRLHGKLRKRIFQKLNEVAAEPYTRLEKVKNTAYFKIRIGGYRAIISVNMKKNKGVLVVVRVRRRSKAYRKIN